MHKLLVDLVIFIITLVGKLKHHSRVSVGCSLPRPQKSSQMLNVQQPLVSGVLMHHLTKINRVWSLVCCTFSLLICEICKTQVRNKNSRDYIVYYPWAIIHTITKTAGVRMWTVSLYSYQQHCKKAITCYVKITSSVFKLYLNQGISVEKSVTCSK